MNRIAKYAMLIILALIFSLLFTGDPLSHAQVPNKIKVHVNINADDEKTETLIQSWVKREIRKLSDVIIVGKDDADCILRIVAVVEKNKVTGRKTGGIAIGYLFLVRFERNPPPNLYLDPTLGVISVGEFNLEHSCKLIVADFDHSPLEPYRKAISEAKKYFENK